LHGSLAVDIASSLTCIYHDLLRRSDNLVKAAERRRVGADQFRAFCGGKVGVTMNGMAVHMTFSELARRACANLGA